MHLNHVIIATLDDWDRGFNINGKGVFLCYKYAAQQMIKQGRGGRIIGACSQAGKHGEHFMYIHTQIHEQPNSGFDSLTVYSATKFTVRSLTQSAGKWMFPSFPWRNSLAYKLYSYSTATAWHYGQCIRTWYVRSSIVKPLSCGSRCVIAGIIETSMREFSFHLSISDGWLNARYSSKLRPSGRTWRT